jgi:hypothetical protein
MNWDSTKRIVCYILVTASISIIGQLDSIGFDFSKITSMGWFSMVLKSLLPGLVAVKALFDDNLINNTKDITNS